MLAVAAGILFAWQNLVLHVQQFSVRDYHPPQLVASVARFFRKALNVVAPQGAASAYEQESEMTPGELLDRWSPMISAASKRFDIPQTWIKNVMRMESGGRTLSGENQPITSRAGAMGLMQLMPGTYREMRTQYGLGNDPYNPHDNIIAGAAYLRWLHGRYGFPAMFAAYNDGPGNLEAGLTTGKPLPAETRNYLSRIVTNLSGVTGGGRHGRVTFTRPDGSPVSIDPASATAIRAVLPGEYATGVQSVIVMETGSQGVRESATVVRAAIRARGGMALTGRLAKIMSGRSAAFGHEHDAQRGRRLSVTYSMLTTPQGIHG